MEAQREQKLVIGLKREDSRENKKLGITVGKEALSKTVVLQGRK